MSVCLYVYTFLCARHSGWTQQGLNPREGYRLEMKSNLQPGGPETSSAWKSCELYPVSRQYIAEANRTSASKLAFVIAYRCSSGYMCDVCVCEYVYCNALQLITVSVIKWAWSSVYQMEQTERTAFDLDFNSKQKIAKAARVLPQNLSTSFRGRMCQWPGSEDRITTKLMCCNFTGRTEGLPRMNWLTS